MAARLLDGTRIAADIRTELIARVEACTLAARRPPTLGILLIGDDPASEVYINIKSKVGDALGLKIDVVRLSKTATLDNAKEVVCRFNRSQGYDGILVQAPLPSALGTIAAQTLFEAIDPAKDVDGFHPTNFGRLAQGHSVFAPCTPSGILELLDRSCINLKGQRAVVIGRSQIVGKPVALMLLHRHATVTVCHSQTRDLRALTREADILIAALGRPAFVTSEFVKPGATVIDVGVNRIVDETTVRSLLPLGSPRLQTFAQRGSLLVGDVHPAVSETAGALTPVPGGVGPLTVAMLMVNIVRAAEMRLGKAV
jgi:methylenetetrahydrofolate dehydrogenase (NADP+)/methenyltetrahydrofolate cyclohydrolase